MFKFSEELISNNKAFNHYLKNSFDVEKIEITRMMTIIAVLIFSLYFIVDILSVKVNLFEIVLVRIAAVLNLLIIYALTFNKRLFLTYYIKFMLYGFFSSGSSIVAMIYFSSETDIAYNTYFAGLMMVVISIFPFTYINTKALIFVGISLIVEYVLVFYYLKGDQSQYHFATTANNMFFIMGALSLGLIVDFMKKKHLYNLFKTEFRLKQILLSPDDNESFIEVRNTNELITVLDKMISDAKMCHINLCVKYFTSKNSKLFKNMSKAIALSIPLKYKIIVIDKETLLYAYFYDDVDKETIEIVDEQIELLLKNEKAKSYRLETYNSTNIDKLIIGLNTDKEMDKGNVVTIK